MHGVRELKSWGELESWEIICFIQPSSFTDKETEAWVPVTYKWDPATLTPKWEVRLIWGPTSLTSESRALPLLYIHCRKTYNEIHFTLFFYFIYRYWLEYSNKLPWILGQCHTHFQGLSKGSIWREVYCQSPWNLSLNRSILLLTVWVMGDLFNSTKLLKLIKIKVFLSL